MQPQDKEAAIPAIKYESGAIHRTAPLRFSQAVECYSAALAVTAIFGSSLPAA